MSVVDEQTTQPCPECGAEMRMDPRFTTWCTECDWNVDPDAPEEGSGRFEKARRARAHRDGERLHARMGDAESAGGGGRLSLILVHAIACAVHAVTVVLTAVAAWCVVRGWGGLGVLLGLVMLLLAWTLRPRLSRLPQGGHVLGRDDAPALYDVIDEVADVAGTRGVDLVVVDAEINASVTSCGLRGRRVLTLGLPLWEMLGSQQRIALLGHELGHFSNGDTRRGLVVGTAYHSLLTWRYYLAPTADPTPVEMVVNLVYLVPRLLIRAVLLTLDRLTSGVHRRGEYLADSFAGRAGSTEAAADLMDKLLVAESAATTMRREANRPRAGRRRPGTATEGADNLWAVLAADVESIPDHEYERRRRVGAARGHCVDSSHPPTHLRRERLLAAAPVPAAVVMSDESERRISGELAGVRRLVAEGILRDGIDG
ncbi:M48 family metallopeptidase [Streptomyces sp. NPDC060030]|uniref:M48 family metallopeptidase n=1 Tax=Streptomyces sp. NPDC060030 TaxID=3347042 RepID=UPI0036877FD3